MYSLLFDEFLELGVLDSEGLFVLKLLSKFSDLDFVGMPVEFASLNFLISKLSRISPIFIVIKELAEPLDFGRLEQADYFQIGAHEMGLFARKFSDHGS